MHKSTFNTRENTLKRKLIAGNFLHYKRTVTVLSVAFIIKKFGQVNLSFGQPEFAFYLPY
jgi:hypothetical protein